MFMPGSLRRAKTNLCGPNKMTNDPLHQNQLDVQKYDDLLSLLGGVSRTLKTSLETFGNAPAPLLEPLKNFYAMDPDSTSTQRIQQFVSHINGFIASLQLGDKHLESVQARLKELHGEIEAVKDTFKKRNESWETHAHYESKVESLKTQIMKASASPKISEKLGEKLQRNEEKKRESEDEFNKCMEACRDISNGVLEKRFGRINELLANLCKWYVMTFESANVLVKEFTDLQSKLREPNAMESIAAKGQELAAQTKEKFSAMTSGVRGKLGGLGAITRSGGSARQVMQDDEEDVSSAPQVASSASAGGSSVSSSGVREAAARLGSKDASPSAATTAAGRMGGTATSATAALASASKMSFFRGQSADNFDAAPPAHQEDEQPDRQSSQRSPSWNPGRGESFTSSAASSSRRRGSSMETYSRKSSDSSQGLAPPPEMGNTRSRKKNKDGGSTSSQRTSRKANSDPPSSTPQGGDFAGGGFAGAGFPAFQNAGTPSGFAFAEAGSGSMGSSSFGDWPSVSSMGGSPQRSGTGSISTAWPSSPAGDSSAPNPAPNVASTSGGFGQFPGKFGGSVSLPAGGSGVETAGIWHQGGSLTLPMGGARGSGGSGGAGAANACQQPVPWPTSPMLHPRPPVGGPAPAQANEAFNALPWQRGFGSGGPPTSDAPNPVPQTAWQQPNSSNAANAANAAAPDPWRSAPGPRQASAFTPWGRA